jgi:hypothetical protein
MYIRTIDTWQGIRVARFDARGIAYPRMKMSGGLRTLAAKILGARVLAPVVAVPILLVLTLLGGAGRVAGVVAATAHHAAVVAARSDRHARAIPARHLAVRPPRVVMAGVGSQQPVAVPAAAGISVLLVLLAGIAPVRSRVRTATRGLCAARAPPFRLA